MRILMVNKYLYPKGGAETYMLKLGAKLEEMGHEVQYFGMFDRQNVVNNKLSAYTDHKDFHKLSWDYLTYPLKIVYSRSARKELRRLLNAFKPDVVHTNNINFQITPSILYEIKRDNIPIIHTAHDPQWVCPNHTLTNPRTMKNCTECLDGHFFGCIKNRCIHSSLIRSIIGTAEARLYRNLHTYRLADKIICPSRFMEKMLSHNPDIKGRTEVVYNFIDKKISNAEKTGHYALYFGRFSAEKGIRTLLKAASELPDIQFVFAGSGDLEEEIDKVPNIKNVGFKKGQELDDLIAGADFSILPSEWAENCPFSVMESQSLNTPVIGADIGGIPELIEDGKNGLLFKSGSVEDLKEKIKYLNENEAVRQNLSENCKNIKYDTIDRYAEKMLLIYKESVEG